MNMNLESSEKDIIDACSKNKLNFCTIKTWECEDEIDNKGWVVYLQTGKVQFPIIISLRDDKPVIDWVNIFSHSEVVIMRWLEYRLSDDEFDDFIFLYIEPDQF